MEKRVTISSHVFKATPQQQADFQELWQRVSEKKGKTRVIRDGLTTQTITTYMGMENGSLFDYAGVRPWSKMLVSLSAFTIRKLTNVLDQGSKSKAPNVFGTKGYQWATFVRLTT